MREDIVVWIKFLEHFKGRTIFQNEFILDSDFCLLTDLAGSMGFAAVWKKHWCAEKWPVRWKKLGFVKNSVLLELFPIVVAIEIWGRYFKNQRILISTDNKEVMFSINCLSAKSPPVTTLLNYLVSKCLKLNIWLKARCIPGKENMIADVLSRLQMQRFFELLPEADKIGVVCPEHLWEII